MTGALLATTLLVGALASHPAWPHSFYSAACCRGADEDGDCAPVPDGDVKFTMAGWLYLGTGDVIPFSKALPSPDGKFHVCLPRGPGAHVRCLLAPQPGF